MREEVSGQKPDCKPIFQMSCPFKVPPPLGRRHILAHLQVAEDGEKKYTLTFSGGLDFFRNEFNKAKISGCQASHPRTGVADYLRLLDSQDGPNAFQAKVAAVLEDVLGGIPVLLTHEILEVEDSFLQWLLGQRSIVLDCSSTALWPLDSASASVAEGA